MDRALPAGSIAALEILRRTAALAGRYPLRIAGWAAVLIGFSLAVDATEIGWDNASAGNFAISVLCLIAQFGLTKSILGDLTGQVAGQPRFPAYFGLGIVTTIGIGLGTLALVIPGIVLLVRWSLAVPILLSSDEEGVFDSIGRSWRETGPHFWPIFLVFLLIYGSITGLSFLGAAIEGEMRDNLAGTIIYDAATSLGLMFGWLAAIAIHHAVDDVVALQGVFE
ncbi:MAG TPA: hypothetical protein VLK25_02575 [Allosphingosinicella sp.]|nr:hypothetical protein [Allosphingosinicella sp.]